MSETAETTAETTTAIVEVPVGSLDGLVITVPAWVGEFAVVGVTAGSAFALVERAAHKWLRYSPLLRRLFPKWFAGSWDEHVDTLARFIKGSDLRFSQVPEEEIKEVIQDPALTAKLLTTGAKLAPDAAVSMVATHLHVAEEKPPELDKHNDWFWKRPRH